MHLIADSVRPYFSADSQLEGDRCFLDGHAYDMDFRSGIVRGFVEDSDTGEEYEAFISFDANRRIKAGCTCNDIIGIQACKHLWALVRSADAEIAKNPTLLVGIMSAASGINITTQPFTKNPAKALPAPDQMSMFLQHMARYDHSRAFPFIDEPDIFPSDKRLCYQLNVDVTAYEDDEPCLSLTICSQKQKANGTYETPKPLNSVELWAASPDDADREIRSILLSRSLDAYADDRFDAGKNIPLGRESLQGVLKRICQTGRATARFSSTYSSDSVQIVPLQWDADAAYEVILSATQSDQTADFAIVFHRDGSEDISADQISARCYDHYLLKNGKLLRAGFSGIGFMEMSRKFFPLSVPRSRAREAVKILSIANGAPRIVASDDIAFPIHDVIPTPLLHVSPHQYIASELEATLYFIYGEHQIEAASSSPAIVVTIDGEEKIIRRKLDAELEAFNTLRAMPIRPMSQSEPTAFRLPSKRLPAVIGTLLRAGWRVEAEGKLYRPARSLAIRVESGIDWFDVRGKADFDGQEVPFPQILEAIRKGETTILLGDGTVGILPDDWLRKYAGFNAAGEIDGDSIRFKPTQVMLLDALLMQLPGVDVDRQFADARQKLASFQKVQACDPDPTFSGTLRPYQRQGLGWLKYLNEFNFGGCLADDMGLGKTIQVLALLESRRIEGKGPSLVVAPRSLIFNWKAEAERFTPKMRILDHSDTGRKKTTEHLSDYDLVLTTYGLLRSDAAILKDFEFDYAILDEAQAIKNSTTASAKAARLINARHRLVMTGTPIENHLGELWSLFDFLNPGMFGSSSGFKVLAGGDTDEKTNRDLISRTIRPFMLRRTKKQVATDLPDRIEQTLFCELEPKQRKVYDQLRDHYRQALLKSVDTVGINKSQIMILEALLRLRQAACAPAIIDPDKHGKIPSAKIDTLITQLTEALEEGHKVLVFSQFTSLLSIVSKQLNDLKITHEYLDGKTKDRQKRVERFQTDAGCGVFLISLKAGGVGLNLTAADYVFLLDPWWNPAAEAQAIDRTHRIGQNRTVMAYRLIAKDTVEEKVLELQRTKRELADSIIGDTEKLSGAVTRDDLALLLS